MDELVVHDSVNENMDRLHDFVLFLLWKSNTTNALIFNTKVGIMFAFNMVHYCALS